MKRARAFVLIAASCGGRADIWDEPLVMSEPVALADQVAWLDRTREETVLLRPFPYRLRRVAAGAAPARIEASPDGTHLAVLSAGDEDEGVAPALTWIDGATGEAASYAIASPFDQIALDAGGRFGLAYFGAASEVEQGVFRNPNEIAILDLSEPPSDENPRLRTVRSFGSTPLGVVFSPPLCLVAESSPCEERTLLCVLAAGAVTFIDLAHPDRSEITLRLQVDGAPLVVPAEILFAPDQGTAFVRGDGSSDVLMINLLPREPDAADGNDWWPSLNQLSAGDGPADLAWFDDAGRRKVLVVNRDSEDVSVIDAATANFVRIEVGAPVDRALLYPEDLPRTALLWASTRTDAAVHFLDLSGVEEAEGGALEDVGMGRAVRDVLRAPDGIHALVIHDDARTVLSVLDLDERTVSPVEGAAALSDFGFSGATLVGISPGQRRVGFLDMTNLHPWDARLDRDPESLSVLGSGAVVVHHAAQAGSVTALPSVGADERDAVRIDGFLLDGILEETP